MTDRKGGRWIPLVYYYLATIVGLGFVLGGLTSSLQGARAAALPHLSDEIRWRVEPASIDEKGRTVKLSDKEKAEARQQAIEEIRLSGLGRVLDGLVYVLVGAPVFLWHLRQARRKEPEWLAGG